MGLQEDKVEFLRKVDLFSQLREYELDIIARHSELINFSKRDVIFKKDSIADEMYVVASGRIGVFSIDSSNEAVIAQIVSGESFGELDLLGKTPRSATAIADLDSELIRFPARNFSSAKIFQDHPYISAYMLYRMLGIVSERIWNVHKLADEKSAWLKDLRKQLLCDKMTGLYNQTFLKEDLEHFLPLSCTTAAFLMIKPDNFKDVNDVYGHKAGDQVLNLMAIFLQSELGEKDIGIRYRGDEFAAVLPDVDRDQAIKKAKEISQAYKSMDLGSVTGGKSIKISVSIGISMYPSEADESAALVDNAHKKMFRARDAGGSRIFI
jgi:diguanylate cyclase